MSVKKLSLKFYKLYQKISNLFLDIFHSYILLQDKFLCINALQFFILSTIALNNLYWLKVIVFIFLYKINSVVN